MRLNYTQKIVFKPALVFGLFLLYSFVITGCISHFDNALTDPGAQELDSSIYGTWFLEKDNESIFLHIGKGGTSGLLKVAMVEFDTQNEVKISQWSGHTSKFDKTNYLNLKWIFPKEEEHDGYLFVKYEITKDQFSIYLMDDTIVEEAVKDGTLKGKIIKGKWSSSAYVTQDQNELKQFILANDKILFKDLTSFPRLMKLP